MKLTVTVDTDQYAGLSWPQGVPLPAAGDEVTLDHEGVGIPRGRLPEERSSSVSDPESRF